MYVNPEIAFDPTSAPVVTAKELVTDAAEPVNTTEVGLPTVRVIAALLTVKVGLVP